MSMKQPNSRQGFLGGCPKELSISLLVSVVIHLAFLFPLLNTRSAPSNLPPSSSLINFTLVNLQSDSPILAEKSDRDFPPSKLDDEPRNLKNDQLVPLQKSDAIPKTPTKTVNKAGVSSPEEKTTVAEPQTEYGSPDRKPKPINLQIPVAPSVLDDYLDSTSLVATVSIDFEGKPLRVIIKQIDNGTPALPKDFLDTIHKILLSTKYKHAMKGGYPSDDTFELELSIASGKITFPSEMTIQLNSHTKDLAPPEATMRRR